MRDEASEVSTDYTMPCRPSSVVELRTSQYADAKEVTRGKLTARLMYWAMSYDT